MLRVVIEQFVGIDTPRTPLVGITQSGAMLDHFPVAIGIVIHQHVNPESVITSPQEHSRELMSGDHDTPGQIHWAPGIVSSLPASAPGVTH